MATAWSTVGAVACVALTAVLAGAGPAGAASPPAQRVSGSGASATAAGGSAASAPGSKPGAPTAPPVPSNATRSSSTGSHSYSAMYPGGGIYQYGDAVQYAQSTTSSTLSLSAPVVDMVAVPSGSPATGSRGFWLASADGEVTPIDGAPSFGSAASLDLYAPIVGMAATPDGNGYWLVALDGGVFSFGDATFYGSEGGQRLDQPIVGMASTPDGNGYWLVAADGGIFTFGDATFYGSMGGRHLAQPVVGMATTTDGNGYWLVAADGGIFTFGDAVFDGSLGATTLQSSIAGMAATPQGNGYWLLEWNGQIFPFGAAKTFGQPQGSPSASPFRTIVPTSDGQGYWLLEPEGFDYSFANPPPVGGDPTIVNAAASQIRPDPDSGYFCNPYGTCEPWCALFATWAWQQGGVPIPSYAFVGNIYDWAAAHGSVLPPTAVATPGDAVLYGTGPRSTSTAVHAGIVAQVWPDGAVVTIEGDAGPGVTGHLAVVVNGPFLPTDATAFANYPVFAFAQP